jgi:transcription-repair coupling factor (superfamily II helicase)
MLEYFRIAVGERLEMTRTLERLVRFGYSRVEQVADPGDFALRGGVLDLFPATFECPLRIELAGNRVVSIRSFNPVSAETLDRHSMVVMLPRQIGARLALPSDRRMPVFGDGPDASSELAPIARSPDLDVPFEGVLNLEDGDIVVHVHHGVGKFIGRTDITTTEGHADAPSGTISAREVSRTGKRSEALILEYAGGDRLYVPMSQVHLVQKYIGLGGRVPALHTLGGVGWERTKARAYAGAWAYAREILEVQAKRLSLPGHAFPPDHEWQRTFEDAFPFRTTADQAAAIEAVKRDMERDQAMDRLLLGDVGYGKTEVALRAAFKAVMGQKQVAVLVPTTILAYQHYRTFNNRLRDFPVTVQMLSRFQTDAEQRRVLQAVRTGGCDIVVGTHRLLSDDIEFNDLGLLIIDEEQRFGVRDKERLKRWRTQMDVLVLSATPIPRTLYLALMGSRDMSLITTPPENRHPVETVVAEDDDASLRRWVAREVERGGQVYVVHPRVADIGKVAERIRRLVPSARVGVAHGQMPEDALERTMIEVIEGRLDVLVTTTIIESGIDIPNANTLIINRADQFGLAGLYQLRGRVGRFTRKAYAYLMVPRGHVLTSDAQERLRAIIQHTALGSGFNIAMEDLKLRGAGNLLGIQQHGHVTAVGFDLYCRLLREAVKHLRPAAEREARVSHAASVN